MLKLFFRGCLSGLVALASAFCLSPGASAATVNFSSTPLLSLAGAPGLVMLTLSRDHRLFYGAYTGTADLDSDGLPDVGFNPNITYYGNFAPDRCYSYVTVLWNDLRFRPVDKASSSTVCKLSGVQYWSGNWLNWATTSRMDALRRVLYGGYRQVDDATTDTTTKTSTILQGAYIPNDSHVWGHEYRPGRDTYDITQYTPLPTPSSGKQHLFVTISPTSNTSYPFLSATVAPVLRYIENADQTTERIWLWASADVAQGIGSASANFYKGGGRSGVPSTDRTLRVEACVPLGTSGEVESGCQGYPLNSKTPTTYKPTGILHTYAVNDSLKFGLLTGSYHRNYSGGVVRRNIGSFNDEVLAATGQFDSANDGIARQIDRITIHGWSGGQYDCGYETSRNRYEGACRSWGAPIGEMMYEGLRYFSGKGSATAVYATGVSTSSNADRTIGFPRLPAWTNPYRPTSLGGSPICSKPVQMVIADPLTSFDSDQLPGAYSGFTSNTNFGAAFGSNDLTGLNVSQEVDAIWTAESLGLRNVFIGQIGSNYDGNPTAKSASGFSSLRGHAPDETQSQGTYYAAGVARFGKYSGVPVGSPSTTPAVATETKKIDTIAVALGSMTPKIEFPNPNGGKISIVPLSKAIYTGNKDPGQYQATGAITGFYYASVSSTSVTAVVNFSDSDQGTDNETDAQAQYTVTVSGSSVSVSIRQLDPYPGGIQSNMGYVISGTTADGLYLEQRSNTSGSGNPASGAVYYLDTLPGQSPKNSSSPLNSTGAPSFTPIPLPTWGTVAPMPAAGGAITTRTFTMATSTSASSGAYIPKDPLWYAAKYGGAVQFKTDGTVDSFQLDSNDDPTTYFKITNPASLPAQVGKAFRAAAAMAAVASTSPVGVGGRSAGTAGVYQVTFDALTWTSRISSFAIDATTGVPSDNVSWEASSLIGTPSSRNLWLGRGASSALRLLPTNSGWNSLNTSEQTDFKSEQIYYYLLGDKSGEERKGGKFRNRGATTKTELGSVIGDIVNSDPQVVSKKDFGYGTADSSYATFLAGITSELLVVNSNDGFMHVFDASLTSSTAGRELFGFMPQAARTNVSQQSRPEYAHSFVLDGPLTFGHAKITVPSSGSIDWRTVVVGAGGTGVKTVFAIDASSTSFSNQSVLWELNESTLPSGTQRDSLGNVTGRPVIGKLANGTWVAIFGNGVNSTSEKARLFVVNLSTGAVISVLDTNNSITGNGLMSVYAVNSTAGYQDTIQYVYGADIRGNIWRFDLSATNTATWTSGAWVFAAPSTRPITAEILVGDTPTAAVSAGKTGKMIYFGTGQFFNTGDTTSTSLQALYGVYDSLSSTSSLTPAVNGDSTLSPVTLSFLSSLQDQRVVTSSTTSPWWDISGKNGWLVELTTGTNLGERVIAPPIRYTRTGVDALLFTSMIPSSDPCNSGVDTWVTSVAPGTGFPTLVYVGVSASSIKIAGGSPRGVFVLSDTTKPTLYVSVSSYGASSFPSTSFNAQSGASQTVCLGSTCTKTRILKFDLDPGTFIKTSTTGGFGRQVWRQIK